MKSCTKCQEKKPLSEYHQSAKASDGRASWCKICVNHKVRERSGRRIRNNTYTQKRKWQLKSRYGITPEEYDAMLVAQRWKCGVCRTDLLLEKRIHVDHCHHTGRVRGVLCHTCNVRLGGWDDPNWRAKAIVYMGVFS